MQIEIIYLATFGMIVLDFAFRQRSFHSIKFFCEKRDGHSKRERMKIIDLYLKRVFAG